MKFSQKIACFFAFFVASVSFSYSQSLIFLEKEEFVQGLTTDIEITSHAEIKNISEEILEIKVKMWIQTLHPGHKVGFCWGACIEPTTKDMVSPTSFYLAPNETSQNFFYGYIDPNYTEGTTIVKFTFFDVENPDDSISYIATFSSLLSSVDNLLELNTMLNLFPNPANDYLQLKLVNCLENNLIVDIYGENGSLQKSIILQNNNNTIDTKDFPSGTYFILFRKNDRIIEKRRFIIRK